MTQDFESRGYALGYAAHKAGRKCIPAHDPAVIPLIREGTPAGTVGTGHTIEILDAWSRGWHKRNLEN